MSQGLEVLIVFVLPNFNLCLLENRTLMKNLNRNPTEEEYSSAWSKFFWWITVKKTLMNWHRFQSTFYQRNIHYNWFLRQCSGQTFLGSFFAICSVFSKDQLERSMNFSTLLICILIAHSMEIFCKVLLFSWAN